MKSMSRTGLADLHLRLLQLEREEEIKRQEHRAKDVKTTLRLVVKTANDEDDVHLLTLEHESKKRLPKHCIERGNQVSASLAPIVNSEGGAVHELAPILNSEGGAVHELAPILNSEGGAGQVANAVVTEVTPMYLTLAFSHNPKARIGQTVCITPLENTDHIKLSKAIKWLKKLKTDRTNHSDESAVLLVREMFKEHQNQAVVPEPDVSLPNKASPLRLISRQLNDSQRKAVELALSDQRLAIIHGPPGTGKTTTVVEVILQHVERGQRVLVCAPSNKAVDNLVEGVRKQTKKVDCGLSMTNVIRLGHLARMDKNHRRFSLTLRAKKLLKRRKYGRISLAQMPLERLKVKEKLLEEALVVMSTLTSLSSVKSRKFDLLVIDECAQATEAACWLAIPFARKVLLAGDPCQLPPTILSQEAARCGLAVSLMERQMELHGEGVVHLLDTQFRMHELIQAWSSRTLYGGRLKAAPEVGNHLLTELPGVRSTIRTEPTLLLVDTAGCKLKETQDAKTSSYRNDGEANLVVYHAKSLVKARVPAKDIGVITPYKQQVALIGRKMRAAGIDVEVNSVDGYQGREKEAILLSLVRSNERGQVGFVGDRRRLNVAVTRARRHLFVVCDTATVCRDYAIRSLMNHMEQNGTVCSAFRDRSRDPSKDSRGTRAESGTLVSTADIPDVPKSLLSANVDVKAVYISRPVKSGGDETGTPGIGLVYSSETSTLAQHVKVPHSAVKEADTFDPAVKVSDSCDSAVKASVSCDSDLNAPGFCDAAANVPDTCDSAVNVSKTCDSAVIASDIFDSAVKAADTRGTVKGFEKRDKASDMCDSAVKVPATCHSAIVIETWDSASKVPDLHDPAVKLPDTQTGSGVKGVSTCDCTVKACDPRHSSIDDRFCSVFEVIGSVSFPADDSENCDPAVEVFDTYNPAVEVIETSDSAVKQRSAIDDGCRIV